VSDLHAHPEKPDQVDVWFSFTDDVDDDGDGEATMLDRDDRTEFHSGDPRELERLLGWPRGMLR
jgi:hypothetical protein